MTAMLRRLWQDDSGQDFAEYALLLTTVVVVTALIITSVGTAANAIFSSAVQKVTEMAKGT